MNKEKRSQKGEKKQEVICKKNPQKKSNKTNSLLISKLCIKSSNLRDVCSPTVS